MRWNKKVCDGARRYDAGQNTRAQSSVPRRDQDGCEKKEKRCISADDVGQRQADREGDSDRGGGCDISQRPTWIPGSHLS